MRTLLGILVSALLFFSQPSFAQPRQLSLSSAIQAALENNANVQITEELQVQAAARAKEQRAVLLPNVNGTAGYVNRRVPGRPGIASRVFPPDNSRAIRHVRCSRAIQRAHSRSFVDTSIPICTSICRRH